MVRTRMINKDTLCEYLDELYPDAHCELNYHNLFELLIAVSLSAQTTDISVNKVTPVLFKKYPTPLDLSTADIKDVEEILKPLGLYRNKAKNIVLASQKIVNDFKGEIPQDLDLLATLPGVGHKTASVVFVEGFKLPAFPVDTHVSRISKRLGIGKENDDVEAIEAKLKRLIPMEKWGKTHHQMIHFGRYFCKAKNPNCENCKLKGFCNFYKSLK